MSIVPKTVSVARTPVPDGHEHGDLQFESVNLGQRTFSPTTGVGRTSGKNAYIYHHASHFDIGSLAIPAGAVFTRAKFSVRANGTESGPITVILEAFSDDPEINAIGPATRTRSLNTRNSGTLVNASLQKLNSTGLLSPPDALLGNHVIYADGRDGMQHRWGQALVCDNDPSGGREILGGIATLSRGAVGGGTIHQEVWTTTGVPGNYAKDALVMTSDTKTLVSLDTGMKNESFTNSGPKYTPSVGEVLMQEHVLNFDAGQPADALVRLWYSYTASGAIEHPVLYGDPTVQGFDKQNFYLVPDITNATKVGSPLTVVMPAFVDGSVYTFGDALYSPSVTIPGFTDLINTAWAQQSSGYLALLLRVSGTPLEDDKRIWESVRSGIQTLPGYNGMTLDFEYRVGAGVTAEASLGPAVISRGEAQPAVFSYADAGPAVITGKGSAAMPAVEATGFAGPAVVAVSSSDKDYGVTADPVPPTAIELIGNALVEHWALDATSDDDATVGGWLGTPVNGPLARATDQNGIANGATTFDGVNQCLDIYSVAHSAAFPYLEGSQSVWARVDSDATWLEFATRYIVRFGKSATNTFEWYKRGDIPSELRADFQNTSSGPSGRIDVAPAPPGVLGSTWHVYSASWSAASNIMRVYIDGVQYGTTVSWPEGWVDDWISGFMTLGAERATGLLPWDGDLSDFRLYNRLLSGAEHLTIYNELY